MAEDNEFSVEANEAEMVAEGGAVQESTDPEVTEADATENTADAPDTTELQSEEMVAEGDVSESDAKDEPAADPEAALAAEPEESADAEYKARLRKYTRELKKLPGQWYIIQSYSGYENKVKTNLDMRIQTLEVEDSIYDVVVPIEQALELKDGKKKLVKRKLLPGYVLVRMDLNDAAWSVVRETPGVTSFVGNEGNATPVKHRDVAKFLMPKEPKVEDDLSKTDANAEGETVVAMPEEEAKPKVAHDFEVGEAVTILSGALASVSATINEIDPETGKIQALVSIFGRETPVELTADQIERIM
nr:transcription termination/antitermination protein NusG [uncultured Corynebacterium sp.]